MDLFLGILKIVAIVLSGASGALSLFGDTRKNGKFTKLGKVSIAGAISMSLVATAIHCLEWSKAISDANDTAKKAQTTEKKLDAISGNATTLAKSLSS